MEEFEGYTVEQLMVLWHRETHRSQTGFKCIHTHGGPNGDYEEVKGAVPALPGGTGIPALPEAVH